MREYYLIPYFGDLIYGSTRFIKAKDLDDVRRKTLAYLKGKSKKPYRITIGLSTKTPSGFIYFGKGTTPYWYPQSSDEKYLIDPRTGKLRRQ